MYPLPVPSRAGMQPDSSTLDKLLHPSNQAFSGLACDPFGPTGGSLAPSGLDTWSTLRGGEHRLTRTQFRVGGKCGLSISWDVARNDADVSARLSPAQLMPYSRKHVIFHRVSACLSPPQLMPYSRKHVIFHRVLAGISKTELDVCERLLSGHVLGLARIDVGTHPPPPPRTPPPSLPPKCPPGRRSSNAGCLGLWRPRGLLCGEKDIWCGAQHAH